MTYHESHKNQGNDNINEERKPTGADTETTNPVLGLF